MDGLDMQGYNWLSNGSGRRFDDPFLMPSSGVIPRTLENALDLSFYLYFLNPQYGSAAGRVARHFITDFDFPGDDGSKSEKDELKDYVNYQLQMPLFLTEMGDEWACLAGETKVPTRTGVCEIRDLVGKTVDVISKGGVYRPATFKSYGVQALHEIEFRDGQKVYATAEHKWEVLNCVGKLVRLPTTSLRKTHKIERTMAPHPGNAAYGRYIGIKAVRKTERVEEVFCCEEPQTHTFVIENGILTGNCYGNVFARIHFPFDRFLVDSRNGKFYAIEFFGNRAKYNWSTLTYTVPDPMDPKQKITLPFIDRKSTDISRIKLRRLNPRYIVILHNTMSGGCRYIYRFETYFLDDVKKGRLHVVNDTPIPMLEAVRRQQDFLFDVGTIFHLKAPTISGVSMADWGLPPTIAHFRNIYQIQIYRKADEAVAMDYLLPFRLFNPKPQTGDMNNTINNVLMGRWNQEMRRIIDLRRKDKFAMHALPFPVEYNEFGANGKTLTPKDLIEFQHGVMLDGMAFPQELFKGTLSYQQVPTAMRLFENSFMFLYLGFNNFSQWALKRIQSWRGQPDIAMRLQKPQMADSLERKQMIFQLGAMGELSRSTAWQTLGIDDVKHEMKSRMEEDMEAQKTQLELQTQMQQQTEAGSLLPEQTQPTGGAPGATPPPSGASGVTPSQQSDSANQLAEYWLSLPVGERSKAMQSTRTNDEDLYALAKLRMENMRNQGASQGKQQVTQNAQQPGQQGPGKPGGGQ